MFSERDFPAYFVQLSSRVIVLKYKSISSEIHDKTRGNQCECEKYTVSVRHAVAHGVKAGGYET